MKKFKHPLSLSLLTLCIGFSALGLSMSNHANAAEPVTIKATLQQEAVNLSTLAQNTQIQSAVKLANSTTSNPANKPSKADLDKLKSTLTTNPLSQKLAELQKSSSLKVVGMMVTDKNGNSLGQTMPAKILNHPQAAKFVSTQIHTPKINSRVKVSFNPTPVARITVGILDSSNNNQVMGTLTEWVNTGNK